MKYYPSDSLCVSYLYMIKLALIAVIVKQVLTRNCNGLRDFKVARLSCVLLCIIITNLSYYPRIHRVFEKNVKLQNVSTTCKKRSLFQEIIYFKMNKLHFRHQLRLVNLMMYFLRT